MITENRVVLVVANEHGDSKAFRKAVNYEGLKIISNVSEIVETWKLNKTPVIAKKNVTYDILRNYLTLEIPNFILGHEDFTSFCHKNGIECGEYLSKEKFNTAKEECFLCDIGKHMDVKGALARYNQVTKNINDLIIYESANFFVKIELGCLKKGMVMICPKNHILSAANFPETQMQEYHEVMEDIEFLLQKIYGDEPVIFFEHGSAPDGYSSHRRSVVHAHTHVAWGVKFEQKYIDMVCLEPMKDIKETRQVKYLSYQEGTKGKLLVVNNPNVYVQRQYPRQVIGKMLGIDNQLTNWRVESFPENMRETFNDFYNFLIGNWNFLAKRIQKRTKGFVKGYPKRADFNQTSK